MECSGKCTFPYQKLFIFFFNPSRGQSMRNRPKRVATKSPILFKILLVIGLYVKFYMCKAFFKNKIQQKLCNI
jgi:hypothetical protein